MNANFISYDLYEYEKNGQPLFFVQLPKALSAGQKVALFEFLEFNCYGNTCQETPVFALELELWFRMILDGNYLVINPRHLKMDQTIIDDICNIIDDDKGESVYAKCVNNQTLMDAIADSGICAGNELTMDLDTYELVE